MPEVVQFSNAVDIPAGLRSLADRIEAGEFTDLQFVTALAVGRAAAFTAFSWGHCSVLECMGALARALAGTGAIMDVYGPDARIAIETLKLNGRDLVDEE